MRIMDRSSRIDRYNYIGIFHTKQYTEENKKKDPPPQKKRPPDSGGSSLNEIAIPKIT